MKNIIIMIILIVMLTIMIKPQTINVKDHIEKNKKEEVVKTDRSNIISKPISRGGNIEVKIFTLTFYTSLPEENGGHNGITCNGSKLIDGMVANNVLPQGTRIFAEKYGELIVSDKGGNNFNNTYRLDVFVSRNRGESNSQYKKRVNAMGVVKVRGYIIK